MRKILIVDKKESIKKEIKKRKKGKQVGKREKEE